MESNLIVVKQLPVIEEHLRVLSEKIDDQVSVAMDMACTADTVRDVKKVRAELNREFKALENQRKTVKAAVLGPYEGFEKTYTQYVGMKFRAADDSLKKKISDVEDVLKDQKEADIREYYIEKAASLNIDPKEYPFERAEINITLSASEKSLKAGADEFLQRIADGLTMIESQPLRDEILVEFRKSLNAPQATAFVIERHRLAEEEHQRAEKRRAEENALKEHASAVESDTETQERLASPTEEVSAPAEECEPVRGEPVYHTKFTVWGTKDKLLAVKEFLDDGGYRYE